MKRILTLFMCCMLLFATASTSVMATSTLEDVVGDNQVVTENTAPDYSSTAPNNGTNYVSGEEFSSDLRDATDLSQKHESAVKVNEALKTVVSIIVQILSYAITLFLVVRVLLDLLYIAIPFSRSFLSNGYMGNPQTGANMQGGMQGMGGMNGMMGGMNGMMGGMRGGYGMNRGMMGGMNGMGGMQGGQQPSTMMGKTQWVSYAALNAVSSAQQVGPDGKPGNPFKIYVKDMIITLVLTSVLIVLAISGALTNLGILLGEVLASGIANLGTMI